MSVVASASLVLGSFAPTLAAQSVSSVNVNPFAGKKPDQAQWVAPGFESATALRETQVNPLLADATLANASLETDESATSYVYIIQFQGEPAALYMGGVAGLDATSPVATGARKLDVQDAGVTAYRSYLAEQRTATLEAMKTLLGQGVEVLYTYDLAYNGVAARLTPDQAAAVANLPGVRYIQREQQYQLHTDVGPQFIGADDIWSGAATGTATKGEGIVVGIIDTGINMDHPSFADVGGDGYDHTNPLGAGNYLGWCAANNPYTTTVLPCNDKLIGVWGYASNTNTPEDQDGHGSHTASTVAGNVVLSATVDGSGAAITRTVSGVAPHANIIAYAACCAGSALQAAIEQIITDSVDVVNYSIGPTTGEANPYTDSNMQGFLAATAAGIFVSVSAGNNGSGASTVGNTAPWVQITAASEHNRSIANSLINITGTVGTPPANIQGKGFTGALGARRIVYAGNYNNNNLCGPFPAGTFNGEIVVCDRGTYGRVEKSQNVANAGGGGFVLVNNAASAASLSGDAFAVPGVFISYAEGTALKTWLAGGGVYTASISGYSVNTNSPFADVMAGFSSRGPSINVPDTIVPSLSAPGVDVLAAYADGHVPTDPEFIMISGTSMASPHAAGAAALMRALYPTWTPAQIKSALMLASYTNMRKENATTAATPFDRGSGRIVVDAAANVGFVLDETAARYTAANPSTGGNPATLNLASMAQDACFGTCTWTRVIRSVWPSVVTYTTSFSTSGNLAVTVSPATFALSPGQTFTLTITANTSAITTTNSWNMGDLNFWPQPQAAPTTPEVGGPIDPSMAHMPVAVRVPNATLDATLYVPTARDSGADVIHGQVGSSYTSTAATIYGLADPQSMPAFASGNDDGDWDTNPLNPAFGWFLYQGIVPANLGRWMVSTSNANVADLDLAVLLDLNNDGTFAWPGERVATSAGSSASEVVDLINLQAHAGKRYMIAVYNWSGEADANFNVNWWAAVPTTGDLTLSNFPTSLAAGEIFTPTLTFNHYMEPGKQYYGLVNFGTSTAERAIGSTLININRTASEVSKSVWPTVASVGDVVTYTIVVQNRDVATRTYMLTDVLPAGVTYVPGSLTGPATYNSGLNAVVFSTTLGAPSQAPDYVFEDSLTNPNLINTTPLGEYVDLASALGASPTPFGDDTFGSFNTLGCNVDFYGTTQGTATAIGFSSNGLFYPRRQSANNTIIGGNGGSFISTTIPSVITPNNFIAAYWDNLVVTPTTGIPDSGYLAATFGACPARASVIQIYNAYRFSDASQQINYQIQFDTDHPGEYWVLYGNISGTLNTGSVGVESFAATNGTQYVYAATPANKVLTTGRVIRYYRPIAAAPPVTVTFQATITNGTNPWITNIADYTVNAPNTSVMHPQAAVGIRGVPASLTTDAAQASTAIFAWNTVTATVWDAGNSPVANQPVTFTVSPTTTTWVSSAQPSVAWLSGANEVPANGSAGTGVVTFTYNANTRMLAYTGSVQGLGGNITAAHIHTGTAGVAGPVLVPLSIITGSTSSTISGTVGPLSAASVAALYSGGLYVNVHSTTFAGGEVRGQLYLYSNSNGEAVVNVTSILPGNTTVAARSWSLQDMTFIDFIAWRLFGPVVGK